VLLGNNEGNSRVENWRCVAECVTARRSSLFKKKAQISGLHEPRHTTENTEVISEDKANSETKWLSN
jgi:hypothetical protein